ncbi:MAG: sce7726 family protein [Pseudobutyrivibrio sp.]|nr:sce7726 family protein [Pseudobutyrivibrio sp.]
MLLDKDIREPLFDYLEEIYGKTRIIEEKMVGSSRADVVMVIDGGLVGLEIKSDSDTYTRLSSQVKDYDKYFDYNITVVGSSHGSHVAEHVPDYWGIITVEELDGQADFYFLREPSPNPKVNISRKMEILWRPELAMIQEHFSMPAYKGKSKRQVVEKIVEWTRIPPTQAEITRLKREQKNNPDREIIIPEYRININELNILISELLFERDYEALLAQINEYRKEHSPRRRGPKKSTRVRRIRRRAKVNK